MRRVYLFFISAVACLLALPLSAQDLEQIVAENEPAVVIITGTRDGTGAEVQSSGCCVSREGHVLTTAHQIDGVSDFNATFSDGSKMPLQLIHFSKEQELALLKTQDPVPATARLGNARSLRSGSPLVSIATPVNLSFTTVRGIVSSTNRTYNGYPVLQADLPASPGSSGGPVFDRYGNLVGMIIGQLEEEQWVTIINPVNNAYELLLEHKIMTPLPAQEDPLLSPTAKASSIETGAIEAYNAGVTAPDPAAKVRAYGEAVKLMPGFFEAWFNQGIAYTQLEDLAAAERAYGKAAQIRPEAVEVKRNLGRLYLRTERFDEAAKTFEETVRLAPDLPQSHNDLGESYRRLGRPEEAVKAFQKALELNPAHPKARYNLALTFAGMDKKGEAIQEFRQYLALEPSPPDAREVKEFIDQLSKQQ